MKRYFHTTVRPGATGEDGRPLHYVDSIYHYITLPDGSHLVVMLQEHAIPEPAWEELPHILDQSPPPAHIATAIGAMGGVVATDHTFHIARKIAKLHPLFHP